MKASIYHIQLNISDPKTGLPFYRDLFAFLDYKIVSESEDHIGVSNGTCDVWVIATEERFVKAGFHRKNTGINHIAFKTSTRKEVDRFVDEFLKPRGIETLYNTPRHFPEYSGGYYAVFFEGPDRLKLEVLSQEEGISGQ